MGWIQLCLSCDWRIDKIISYQSKAGWRRNVCVCTYVYVCVRVCTCTNQGRLPGRGRVQSAWGMHDCMAKGVLAEGIMEALGIWWGLSW